LQLWVAGFVVLMALPVLIGFGFSIWAAMLPSAAEDAAQPASP
jgi:hypothetical protein